MQVELSNFSAELSRLAVANRHNGPLWVGLAGAPGSGKSTVANQMAQTFGDRICVIPMDGYHFRREVLQQMHHAENAVARRGAPFTFDSDRFVEDLLKAKQSGRSLFPMFEHATADPVENAICYDSSRTDIVLIEGNYLLLDTNPWCRLAAEVFDLTCWLNVPIPVCCERMHHRNLSLGMSEQCSRQKISGNDRLNAELVIQTGPEQADWLLLAS